VRAVSIGSAGGTRRGARWRRSCSRHSWRDGCDSLFGGRPGATGRADGWCGISDYGRCALCLYPLDEGDRNHLGPNPGGLALGSHGARNSDRAGETLHVNGPDRNGLLWLESVLSARLLIVPTVTVAMARPNARMIGVAYLAYFVIGGIGQALALRDAASALAVAVQVGGTIWYAIVALLLCRLFGDPTRGIGV